MLRDFLLRNLLGHEQVYEQVRSQYEEDGKYFWEDEKGLHIMLSDTEWSSGNELREFVDRIDAAGGRTTEFRKQNGL